MNPANQLAAAIAATIPYVGGPHCGKVEFVTGPVQFRRCYRDCEDPYRFHVYELARDHTGRAVYRYQGVAR